jgi:DNA-binding CsgD family transcriptional regulator
LQRHVAGRELADDVAVALHRLTHGNPLAAIEIAATLTLPQRSGAEPLPDFPALGADVVSAVTVPLVGLAPDTRHALALAAAEPTGELRVLSIAASVLGVRLDALEPAEELGIVVVDDGRVSFDLPLRRWAIYHSVAPPSRRAAHRALARAHDGPGDAERRALHLALGATEPDERLAADLELAAQAAERRGDSAAARQWWQHAARLSPIRADADARRRRSRLAGGAASGPLAALTDAERRVAEVVGNGSSNKGAATTLGVSVKTVDTHLQSIYRKLGLRSRSELAMVVARHAGGTWEEVG